MSQYLNIVLDEAIELCKQCTTGKKVSYEQRLTTYLQDGIQTKAFVAAIKCF